MIRFYFFKKILSIYKKIKGKNKHYFPKSQKNWIFIGFFPANINI